MKKLLAGDKQCDWKPKNRIKFEGELIERWIELKSNEQFSRYRSLYLLLYMNELIIIHIFELLWNIYFCFYIFFGKKFCIGDNFRFLIEEVNKNYAEIFIREQFEFLLPRRN